MSTVAQARDAKGIAQEYFSVWMRGDFDRVRSLPPWPSPRWSSTAATSPTTLTAPFRREGITAQCNPALYGPTRQQ